MSVCLSPVAKAQPTTGPPYLSVHSDMMKQKQLISRGD